jgi:hypothetical protein
MKLTDDGPHGKYFAELEFLKAAKFKSNFYQTPCNYRNYAANYLPNWYNGTW